MTNQDKADIIRQVDQALDQDETPNLDWPDYQYRTGTDGRMVLVE